MPNRPRPRRASPSSSGHAAECAIPRCSMGSSTQTGKRPHSPLSMSRSCAVVENERDVQARDGRKLNVHDLAVERAVEAVTAGNLHGAEPADPKVVKELLRRGRVKLRFDW